MEEKSGFFRAEDPLINSLLAPSVSCIVSYKFGPQDLYEGHLCGKHPVFRKDAYLPRMHTYF